MSPRRSFPLALGACLTALVAARALADTGTAPGYGSPGNALNPGGQLLSLPRDPQGLSQLDDVTRTPTGLLYPLPYAVPQLTQSKDDPDWWSSGWVEGGGLGSFGARPGSADRNKYADWSNGPLLQNLGFYAENRKTALYISGLAENVGRADQFYQLKTGRFGEFSVTTFFDAVPHDYTTQARSIWNGLGTSTLTLKDGLVPGKSTAAQVTAVANAAPPSELRVTRQKAGMSVSYTPAKEIEAVLQLSNEWRDGAQPISATFGYPFENGATQIAAPVHYQTLDITGALRWKEDDLQANLTYTGSFFRNSNQTLTWDNPGLAQVSAGSFIPTQGRLTLPPSNSYHSLKADVTALLSPALRFSASLSYNLMRQNDALAPPTIDSGVINGAGGPINLSNWNTTAALSQTSAHAAIDMFNAFARLQYVVSSDLTLEMELRDHNEMNRTNYLAFNPQTGQYGYIAVDGGLAAFQPALSGVFQPGAPGSLVQIRNMPFANDNLELTAHAAYRLDKHFKLDASYVHNEIRHSDREVPDADDNRLRLQLAGTGYEWGTLRISYEYGSLTGSDYTSDPYTAFYSSALPGYVPQTPQGDAPFTLANLRKFDVGDRAEHLVHAQTNYILSPRTDLQFAADYKADDYAAAYGLRASSSVDVNADVNYQMSLDTTMTGFFTMQLQHRSVAGINPSGLPGSAEAGSAAYPLANAWNQALGDHDYSAGFTFHKSWDKVSFDADYTFSHGDSALGYGYASTGAFFNMLTAAQAGTSFPDIVFDSHALSTNLRWQAAAHLAYRLLYRVDFQSLDDFHYNNLAPVISNNTYLGIVPENFTVQTLGFMVQYTF